MSVLKNLMEQISASTERIFAQEQVATPVWIIIDGRETLHVVPAPPFDKDISVRLMKMMMIHIQAIRVVFVDEAWTLHTTHKINEEEIQRIKDEGLSDHPDRIEVVVLMGEDEKEGSMMAHRRIIREEGKAATGEGRMVGLLPRKGRHDA